MILYIFKYLELFNFGETDFKYPPSSNFTALNEASLDAVTKSSATVGPGVKRAAAPNAPYAIIIEPSRELAEQTLNEIKKFKKYLTENEVRELLVMGGGAAREQIESLKRGVHIVVATPGEIMRESTPLQINVFLWHNYQHN